jgi:alpha-beta hydrolase superfamily lysophospholipase
MTTENVRNTLDFSKGGHIAAADGVPLWMRAVEPEGRVRADVIVTHGLGEHSGRYDHVMRALVGHGLRVCAWDLRGHGRSGGARGDAARYELLVEDLGRVVANVAEGGRPWFLLAHSMGAQVVLRFLEGENAPCSGAVILSPWLRLAFDPPWWKLALARAALRIFPAFTQDTGNRWERLSRDAAHLGSLPDPELVHHRISARLYFGVRSAGEAAMVDADRLRTPLLLLHGDDDPVTSHRATCEFFEQVPSADKTLRILPGARHETHNDLDREVVIREVCDWIGARVGPPV